MARNEDPIDMVADSCSERSASSSPDRQVSLPRAVLPTGIGGNLQMAVTNLVAADCAPAPDIWRPLYLRTSSPEGGDHPVPSTVEWEPLSPAATRDGDNHSGCFS